MQPIRGIAPAVRIPRLAPHNATESTVASARPRLIAPPHHCIAPSKNAKPVFPPEALLHTVRTSSPRPTRQRAPDPVKRRSEEHTSELQSLMRISYADFCLKKKNP